MALMAEMGSFAMEQSAGQTRVTIEGLRPDINAGMLA